MIITYYLFNHVRHQHAVPHPFRPGSRTHGRTYDLTVIHTHHRKMSWSTPVRRVFFSQKIRSSSRSPGSGLGSEVAHTASHYIPLPGSIASAGQEEEGVTDAPRGVYMGSHTEWALPPTRRPQRNRPKSASRTIIPSVTANKSRKTFDFFPPTFLRLYFS